MRCWLAVLVMLLCACDKISNNTGGGGNSAARSGELELPEEARRYATTESTLTVGDVNLLKMFPLPRMDESQPKHVEQLERPGEHPVVQMLVEVDAPIEKVADYYDG